MLCVLLCRFDVMNDMCILMCRCSASGGELFDRLILEKRIPEKTASCLAGRLFDAVAYLHSMGIIHRDLKPENILFSDHSKTAELKISDFGFSVKLFTKPNLSRAKSALGTQGYAAPEVFSGQPYDGMLWANAR